MDLTLSIDEQESVKTFMEEVTKQSFTKDPNNTPVSWTTAVKFLMARKFDVRRAIDLYNSHEIVRRKEGLKEFNLHDESFKRELYSEKLTILPTRDEFGAAIALFTARLHNPLQSSHQAVLKALIFQLDIALESIETQRDGLVFIYDMTHSKYQNFDYELSIKILSMLKGSYPAKLKKVLIVTAPLWFKAPFKILRLFVREKLRDRVYTVSTLQLCQHIPPESLPSRFGGKLEINHREWISHCLLSAWNSSPDMEREIATYLEPMNNHMFNMFSSTSTTASADLYPFDYDPDCLDHRFTWKDDCFDFSGDLSDEWSGSLNSPPSPFSIATTRNSSQRKRSADLASPTTFAPPGDGDKLLVLPNKKRSSSEELDSSYNSIVPESIHMPESVGLTIKELVEYCRIKGRRGLYKEYAQLKSESPDGTFEVSKSKANLSKNRYTDVLCLDETRVKLIPILGDPSSDYINANYVDGYKRKSAYISTQGPLPKTFPDFWRMIWEQNVLVIVMTTRTTERGRVKCGQYWPLDKEGIQQHDNFVVINNGVVSNDCYIESTLLLQNLESVETREISHIQLTSWRDYDVPHSADGFLTFMLHVREKQSERVRKLRVNNPNCTGKEPPVVIHCSAGIGRTGTFIAMDINTRRLMDTGRVDVQKTVRRIRSQRAFSIQMPDQYVFCHMALVEYAQQQGLIGEIDLECFNDDSSSESD